MLKRYTSPSNECQPAHQHMINSECQKIISGSLVSSCSDNKKLHSIMFTKAAHNDSLACT